MSLNESSSVLNANNEATCDFRIEGSTVTSLLDLQNLLDPGNDFVRRRVARLVEVDDTVVLQNVDGAFHGGVTTR